MIAGRILGWLMICDPRTDRSRDRAGDRRESRIPDQQPALTQWNRLPYGAHSPRRQIESMTQLRDILQDGANLTGPTQRGQRLREAIDAFNRMERALVDEPGKPRNRLEHGR